MTPVVWGDLVFDERDGCLVATCTQTDEEPCCANANCDRMVPVRHPTSWRGVSGGTAEQNARLFLHLAKNLGIDLEEVHRSAVESSLHRKRVFITPSIDNLAHALDLTKEPTS